MLADLLRQLLAHTFLDPSSPQTHAVSVLFWIGGAVAVFILAIPTAALAYTITHFRRKPGDGEPPQIYGHTRLEIAWTVVPTVIVLVIFGLSWHTMGLAEPGGEAMAANERTDLTVIGHQWWWELRYPSGVVTANEIHIPVHTRWLVALKSADVVHGFWVPQVANQMYLIPAQTNHIWLEADTPGVFEGQCAEFCGAAHAWMLLRVIAQTPAQFATWQRDQLRAAPRPSGGARYGAPPSRATANVGARTRVPAAGSQQALVATGAQLFQQLPCQSCHAIAGTPAHADVGPDLTHVGSRTTLAAGRLSNTPAHMQDWLHDPQTLKEGNHMPDLLLTPRQVTALSAYLESLK